LICIWSVKISSWNWEKISAKWRDHYSFTPSLIVPMKKWFWESKWWWYGLKWSRNFALWLYHIKNGIYYLLPEKIYWAKTERDITYNKKIDDLTDFGYVKHRTNKISNLWTVDSHWCIRTEWIMIDILRGVENKWLYKYTISENYWSWVEPYLPKKIKINLK
jgi:hypothetical protein